MRFNYIRERKDMENYLAEENLFLKTQNKDLEVKIFIQQEMIQRLNREIKRFKEYESRRNITREIIKKNPPKELEEPSIDCIKCSVCLNFKINTVLNCSHVVCSKCCVHLNKCPVCRAEIKEVVFFKF